MIGIYTVKEYSGGTENKLIRQRTAIYGYSGIILDENNNTNVTKMSELTDSKVDTYSLELVLRLYEGYGYEEVT